jgi:hypothetical protein
MSGFSMVTVFLPLISQLNSCEVMLKHRSPFPLMELVRYQSILFMLWEVVKNGTCDSNVYSVENQAWNRVDTSGSAYKPTPTRGAALVALGNGKLVLVGGLACTGQSTMSVSRLEISNNTGVWQLDASGAGPSARQGHTVVLDTLTKNQSFILFGGVNAAGTVLDDVWRYDLGSLMWTHIGPGQAGESWPPARTYHSSVWGRGRVLFFGGQNTQIDFLPNNEIWQLILNMDCFTQQICQDCIGQDGCGWCQRNAKTHQCVAGSPLTGAYGFNNCAEDDPFVIDTLDCQPLFPGWIISLIIIACIVVLGIIVYFVMRVRNPEYQQLT